MKVLVTGGSGFIGSHVVDRLRARGIEVRVFDMVLPTYRKDVEFYQGSLLDFDAFRMSLTGIDVVYHLAAVADVNDVVAEPAYAEAINVRGTFNVLEAVRRTPNVKRVIYGSTTWVYSETLEQAVDEQTPLLAPHHLYTATKMASEYYCRSYATMYGLKYTILRYGIPYGPRARYGAVVPIFVTKALRGEPLTIAGDGLQFRKFVYVEDLAEGNVLALKSVAENKTYNLDGIEKVTIRQIAETVKGLVGGNVEIKYTEGRKGDFGGKEVSSALARRELGWEPSVRFEEGVRRYLDWYKSRELASEAAWGKVDEMLRGEFAR
ncbi:MAG: NAD-dependent epimerase/dehydratase family protein [Acidobacteriia bacterium]|nr:NAD-dependent epimerase/dehydratase family protein [Terriglobia bacterium]